jgi:hypothetical protein
VTDSTHLLCLWRLVQASLKMLDAGPSEQLPTLGHFLKLLLLLLVLHLSRKPSALFGAEPIFPHLTQCIPPWSLGGLTLKLWKIARASVRDCRPGEWLPSPPEMRQPAQATFGRYWPQGGLARAPGIRRPCDSITGWRTRSGSSLQNTNRALSAATSDHDLGASASGRIKSLGCAVAV